MKKNYNLLFCAVMMLSFISVNGQQRYIDDVFESTSVESNIVYGSNISILLAPQGIIEPIDLVMDIYTPDGDDVTDRPVMIVIGTGNFLPQYFNGGITGGLQDSINVNTCKRLAAKGYVAANITYRQGWAPLAEDQDTRTATLLQAAYRGIQDARTAVRFLRKTFAEDGNPYGIDPNKVGMWGIGTGGYVSLGASVLDRYEEVVLDKFLNSQTLEPLIDTTIIGNPYATTQAAASLPNHVGYSSDFSICVNVGGAMGDISWLEGKENEPAFVGFHATGDIFAPFPDGPVIVPTTNEFVVNVSGTRTVIDSANMKGNNDVFDAILDEFDPLSANVEAQSAATIQWSENYSTSAGVENMYAFQTPIPIGSPWNWWNKNTLDLQIAFINASIGTTFNADTLHQNGLLTNPNMSAAQGMAYLDTMMLYFAPRGCVALDLGCLITGVNELKPLDVGLKVYPNPVRNMTTIQVNLDESIDKVYLYSIEGRLVKSERGINSNVYQLDRNNLPSGSYIAKIHTESGVVAQKIQFE
ncbi:T9SS type A sorting domain-containing protein [Portibacter marinus]|uniref:T9SS type A sorting domain-containing protein n=1 Tax=Portibacter marinus TaxID=2898660 RepID=UPI001F3E029D|nr:T9SS type A sorting domain-containing protein [Portibacter marinus]